jgi:hypothetical protein
MKIAKICGARNRQGRPCQCKKLLGGRKCKFHGGMSTGPRTPEGKARSAANLPPRFPKPKRDGDPTDAPAAPQGDLEEARIDSA